MKAFDTVKLTDEGIVLLDQTCLPWEKRFVVLKTVEEVASAITELKVRGAPLIGITAGYGVVIAARNTNGDRGAVMDAISLLRATRPTAVNLFYVLSRMEKLCEGGGSDLVERLTQEALSIHREDEEACERMGKLGSKLLSGDGWVMTQCNTGMLATGGIGTALGVIYTAFFSGRDIGVYVPETRPLLQGSRLTAWELMEHNIPVRLIVDGAKGWVLASGEVKAVLVGADRIAMNGDTANKIGTYPLAVLCAKHNIPFYVVAPVTTIDPEIEGGDDIVIEHRSPDEIVFVMGKLQVAPLDAPAVNPAFDVTPADLITAIITDRGIAYPPYTQSIRELLR